MNQLQKLPARISSTPVHRRGSVNKSRAEKRDFIAAPHHPNNTAGEYP